MSRAEKRQQRRLKKEQNNNLVAYSAENDIKYRAPLGINHVRTIAWLCIVLTQIAALIGASNSIMGREIVSSGVVSAIQLFASMSVPLFLISSFSYILQNRDRCGRIVLFYLSLSMIIPFLYFLVFFHYGTGLLKAFSSPAAENLNEAVSVLVADALGSSLNCNIFIDMALFSSLTFFLTAKPKLKIFSGKRLWIFRALALIPILYEVGAFAYKLECILGKALPTLYGYAFMPTKAPLTFIAFMLVLAFELSRKRRYISLGGSEEGYAEFFMTRKNSLMFAKSTAKTFAFIGGVDILFMCICYCIMYLGNAADMNILFELGIGNSADLLTLAPFVLLFSYNRKPKIANYNLILPIVMIFVLVLVFLEGGYFMLTGRL